MVLDIKLLTVVLTVTSPLVYSARAQRSAQCTHWTRWYSRDHPSGSGDWEVLSHIRPENPGQICSAPSAIQARTRGTHVDASQTGERFQSYDKTVGFVCRNSHQSDRYCLDYEVRFCCDLAPTESAKLQSEVEELAKDLPRTLQELGLTSVVQDVQELKTDEYQGCYQDASRHKFPRKVLTLSSMTIERCTRACRNAGFNYAAVERSRHSWYYHDCHCGTEGNFNSLGERLCDGECNSRCRGNSRQKCGGYYKMSVYEIDAVPSCESGPRRVSPHWYQTSTTTVLQYRGGQTTRPFAFATPTLGGDRTIPVQSTLVNLEEDVQGFPARYPATTAEGMPNLVSDYRDLLASFQAPGLELTPGTNTMLKLDQHFTIKSYPCSLEYSPTGGRGKRAVTIKIKIVSYRPFKVIIEICIS